MTDKVNIMEAAEPLAREPEVRPATLASLELDAMPTALHFRRSHFPVPAPPGSVAVTGEVRRPFTIDLEALRERGSVHTVRAVLECAGHRRSELDPPAPGISWGLGAVSEAEWTGVRLRDVLGAADLSPDAAFVAFHGADRGESALAGGEVSFGRAVALGKALDRDTVLAWAMNGEPIPPVHGGPLRVIVPGHYAVDSVKWLEQVEVLDRPFTGAFQARDYRLYEPGGAPGGVELHELPVHALLVSPAEGEPIARGRSVLTGVAWAGTGIGRVEVDVDGRGWRGAWLEPSTRWGRVRWRMPWYARPGQHTIGVRATDLAGARQPKWPRWNELGYANNSVHRSSITVR
jgi:DMSO/TMAO reductase YedYZ molybdopterin-dependent catalytic subunit